MGSVLLFCCCASPGAIRALCHLPKALLTSNTAATSSLDPKYVAGLFSICPRARNGNLDGVHVLMYHHQVCFVITRLPHNKRGVLQVETDKHLDKLNKVFTRSVRDCIFVFGSSNLYVQGSWFVCLGFWKRFVDLVRKTNYILTFLHVFVFVLLAGCGVQATLLSRKSSPCEFTGRSSMIFAESIYRSEKLKYFCVYLLSHASQETKQRRGKHPASNPVEFYSWLLF